MGEKHRDKSFYRDDLFLKESLNSRRSYHRTNDYHDDLNKNVHDDGYTFSDTLSRSPRNSDSVHQSASEKNSGEYRDRRKEYSKASLKGFGSRSFENFRSSRGGSASSSMDVSPRFSSRSPSPRSENQRFRNSDSSYYSSSLHSTSSSSHRVSKEQNSHAYPGSYKGSSSSYRHSFSNSGNLSLFNLSSTSSQGYIGASLRDSGSGTSQQSWLYKIPPNTFAWEMTTRIFVSPAQEQEKDFLRLNEELAFLDEKSKIVFKEKRLSVFEWQKMVHKSEREAQNVEFSEKLLESSVNGSLYN
ncbi:hypothetical protein PORY_002215 [Pneumocystis oryctolagi]|uniref:Uncharacterized protein n=1 Tax=Pneumocystis oryctolagi TaxID=42067 RepID=A0ACB7CAK4_9ASCO|nr:hypothetical protein PORY_002215 [Pneumocystis oryctolagi]